MSSRRRVPAEVVAAPLRCPAWQVIRLVHFRINDELASRKADLAHIHGSAQNARELLVHDRTLRRCEVEAMLIEPRVGLHVVIDCLGLERFDVSSDYCLSDLRSNL